MLNEQQGLIVATAGSFAAAQLRPNAALWDREERLDRDVLRRAGELGFAGIYVSEELGGSAMSRLDAALIFEALSRGCVATASFLTIHNMATWMVDRYADEELKRKYVPQLASGERIISYCLTEPGAGSDAAGLRTKATRDGDDYLLNGSKAFISGGGYSDVYLVMARTGEAGPKGVSAFLVDKGTPGLSFGKKEDKMGWRAQPTAMVNFDDCRIPASNRIGAEGGGFGFAMSGLNGGRLNIAACSLGGAQEALERALQYARERKQFGRAIADFQAMQFKLADMETNTQAARAFLYEAARRLDEQAPDAVGFCAMAKRFVTDACFEVANQALQVHGGYGYLTEYELERIVRDLRVHQILEGTNEIMRVIISRQLLGT